MCPSASGLGKAGLRMDQADLDRLVIRLHAIEYPVLRRPPVPFGAPPTAELIAWAIDIHTFCVIVHVRELLESFGLLARGRHSPTTFLVARALLEVAGHGAYVLRRLQKSIDGADFPGAWELLHKATFGRRSFLDRAAATARLGSPWPAPINAMDDVRALGDWLPGETREERERAAEDIYGYLSEFCHPNIGTFAQYVSSWERGEAFFMAIRLAPSGEPPDAETAIALGIALLVAERLIFIYGRHPNIASQLRSIANSLAGTSREPH